MAKIAYEIDFIDSDYKSDSFKGGAGRSLKSFLRDFGAGVLEKNVKILEGTGTFPIVLSERDSYSAIGSALHDLTPYVGSECSVKLRPKTYGEQEKQKDCYVDFWCMEKDGKFEVWLEAKIVGYNIGKTAKWECNADLTNTLKNALEQLQTLKKSNATKISDNNVFRVALLNNVVYYTKNQKSDDADIEAAPKYIHKQVVEATKSCAKNLRIKEENVHILTSVLDLHTFESWEELGYYECPYVLLHTIVLEGLK
ncbi:hypothetical protein [uncultured Helicobacter sp.]|uniref:hypothetical protein n=2 Tax=uncultured Helicobacter sp. TaxID=175537 RepID=UPI001C3BE437|nr:hypothetical protein [Candidatus Helicobacter avicola]